MAMTGEASAVIHALTVDFDLENWNTLLMASFSVSGVVLVAFCPFLIIPFYHSHICLLLSLAMAATFEPIFHDHSWNLCINALSGTQYVDHFELVP